MSGACARELPPLDVTRGCHRCLGVLRRAQEPLPRSPAQEPGWPRRALSFLSEDGSGDSDTWVALGDIAEAGPLSSTRRSLLDEPGDSGVPSLCPQDPHDVPSLCPQDPHDVPSLCPQDPRGDTAVPLPPLASSTLLWDREPPPSRTLGTRTGCPLKPSLGDIPVPCPRVARGVSLRRHQGGILGTHAMSPRSPPARGGCLVAPRSCGDTAGDIPEGWRGAVPKAGVTRPGGADRAAFGDIGDIGDSGDSFGDSSDSFVTASESLGGGGAGGAQPGGPEGAELGQNLGLGRDLGLGRNLKQDLDLGQDSGRDLRQNLGQDLGLGRNLRQNLGQDLGRDLGGNLGQDLDLGRDLGRDFGQGLDSGQDLDLGRNLRSGAAPQTPESCWDLGALLALLGGSPPRCPGDVTSRGCDNSGDRHVTPRSRSRLRAVASRLRLCSSSSPETLPMSPRPPAVAVTSCGDTQTLPGLSPGGGSAPKSGLGVPRGLGDKGHPRSCSGSCPRGFGDKGTPSVPLSPGCATPHSEDVTPDQAPCKCHSPGGGTDVTSSPRGRPGATSSPRGGTKVTNRLRGDTGATSSPRSGTKVTGSPRGGTDVTNRLRGDTGATSSPRSGTDVTSSPRGRPGATSSPQGDLGATNHPRGDTAATSSPRGRPDVTSHPRGAQGRLCPQGWPCPQGHSPELVAALRSGLVPDCAQDELALSRHFQSPSQGRLRGSFNYLLLDPRVTRDLPRRSPQLSPAQRFRDFVTAVFYVGKGTRARPWWHLRQARAQQRRGTAGGCPKVRRILAIWGSGQGVVPLLCFPHRAPREALTRESCMLEALGLQSLTNARRGRCYGPAAAWGGERRRRLGVTLLYRAMGVLLAQGECQLYPGDIPG